MCKETQTVTIVEIEEIRSFFQKACEPGLNGQYFRSVLYAQIQAMIGKRALKKEGHNFPDNPDDIGDRSLIYGQRSCEIYKGKVYLAQTPWEDHQDIRERGEIPSTEYRVSGEQFFLRNRPSVPIIRCDGSIPVSEIPLLRQRYILLNSAVDKIL